MGGGWRAVQSLRRAPPSPSHEVAPAALPPCETRSHTILVKNITHGVSVCFACFLGAVGESFARGGGKRLTVNVPN